MDPGDSCRLDERPPLAVVRLAWARRAGTGSVLGWGDAARAAIPQYQRFGPIPSPIENSMSTLPAAKSPSETKLLRTSRSIGASNRAVGPISTFTGPSCPPIANRGLIARPESRIELGL